MGYQNQNNCTMLGRINWLVFQSESMVIVSRTYHTIGTEQTIWFCLDIILPIDISTLDIKECFVELIGESKLLPVLLIH